MTFQKVSNLLGRDNHRFRVALQQHGRASRMILLRVKADDVFKMLHFERIQMLEQLFDLTPLYRVDER